jgi:hypothetical protein
MLETALTDDRTTAMAGTSYTAQSRQQSLLQVQLHVM